MKPGRNDPCPCGSGKKYKQCCGAEGRPPAAAVNVMQLLQGALAQHQSGQLAQAEALYRQALAVQPSNPDALHLLGVLCYQSGRSAAAVELIGRALMTNPAFPQACFNLGIALKSLGRLDEAATAYQRAIDLKPDYAEAHDNLGNILKELGRDEEAAASYRQALAVNPASAITHNNLGNVLKSLGRLDDAMASYQQAIALNPAYAEAHGNLGNALREQGRLDDAAASYSRALHFNADIADVHYGLGSLLQDQGRTEEALPCIERAVALKPDFAEAHFTLGRLYAKLGRLQDAALSYQRVAALRPGYTDVHYLLGCILKDQGHAEEAAASYRHEIANHPGHVGAHSDLGTALLDMDRSEEAAACFRRAIELQPDFAAAHYNLGLALTAQLRLEEAAASYRRSLALRPEFEAYNNLGNVLKDQGRLDEAAENYRQACAMRPEATEPHSNLLFLLNYRAGYDAAALYADHLDWAQRHAEALSAAAAPLGNDPDPARRLKIGYVSADLRDHAVAYFIEPVLQCHDHSRFEIFCYSNHTLVDAVTQRLQGHADHWRAIADLSDEAAADMIRTDGIDILIDLSGHSAHNRLPLFARKPAPVQATWIGYANTTGMSAMDYRFTDANLDPVGMTERYHTEQLVRLPVSACFQPAADSPAVNELPALAAGHVTFACFNNFTKVTEETIACWAQVLAAVPGSRLMLLIGDVENSAARQRTEALFAQHGIAPEQLQLVGRHPLAQYLALHHQVDIALDPFPYNGGTTSVHSLWMGVPVVTLAGSTAVSRVGVTILANAGHEELIAHSVEDYVAIAAGLARDLPRLDKIRAELRARMQASPLIDADGLTRALEAACRTMWQTWCTRNIDETRTQ
jgi:predicted O-linked N-acetylglucosamine transferase (SPINDLY family)